MSGHPFDMLLSNLKGKFPVSPGFLPKEFAYEILKLISEEDWGYDADAWAGRREEIVAKMDARAELSDEDEKKRDADVMRWLREQRRKHEDV